MTKVIDKRQKKKNKDIPAEEWFIPRNVNTFSCLHRNLRNELRTVVGNVYLDNVIEYLYKNLYQVPSQQRMLMYSLFCGVTYQQLPRSVSDGKVSFVIDEPPGTSMYRISICVNDIPISSTGSSSPFYDIIIGADVNRYGGRLGFYSRHFIQTLTGLYLHNVPWFYDDKLQALNSVLSRTSPSSLLAMLLSGGVVGYEDVTAIYVDSYYVFRKLRAGIANTHLEGLLSRKRKIGDDIDLEAAYLKAEKDSDHTSDLFAWLVYKLQLKYKDVGLLTVHDLPYAPFGMMSVHNALCAANRIILENHPDILDHSYISSFDKLVLAYKCLHEEDNI